MSAAVTVALAIVLFVALAAVFFATAARRDRANATGLREAVRSRDVIGQAKGILMERHSIDEPTAFELLREHARSTNRKVVDVASAVVDGHRLLPKQPHSPAPTHRA